MTSIIKDTLLDIIKLLPFLFIAFLIMEYIEHKFSEKGQKIVKSSGKLGPLIGSFLGAIPQCGFSVMATNLYATRIITIGTLISIYLSTSDEMLPILISEGTNFKLIIIIIIMKIIVGLICGFLIDLIFRKREKNSHIKDFCEEEHCECNKGILKSSIKHTLNITLFLLIITFILNFAISFLGEEKLGTLFLKDTFLSPFISSLIGLIPNCAASIIITELYLNGALSFASTIAGLLTGSGVAILVLFRVNKHLKENMFILLTVYLIGSITGIIIELFSLLF